MRLLLHSSHLLPLYICNAGLHDAMMRGPASPAFVAQLHIHWILMRCSCVLFSLLRCLRQND
jgi:hypothetical protein